MAFYYTLYKGFAWTISRMPFPLIYAVSGILKLLLKDVLRYRKNIIKTNLRKAFPDKPEKEIRRISDRYYRNLSDITLEIIKLARIRPSSLTQRFTFRNIELLKKSLENHKSVIIAIGHMGNWEWMGTALGLSADHKGYALTKPLTDEYFNRYMASLRHRLNPESTIPFKSAFREMVRNKDVPSFYVIAADQTPTLDEAHYWTTFLNQETPFFLGIEKIARSLDFDVIFVDIRRTGRGKYCGHVHLITDHPTETSEEEIMKKYVSLLEDAIRNDPPNWLWSHRRWKHSRIGGK